MRDFYRAFVSGFRDEIVIEHPIEILSGHLGDRLELFNHSSTSLFEFYVVSVIGFRLYLFTC